MTVKLKRVEEGVHKLDMRVRISTQPGPWKTLLQIFSLTLGKARRDMVLHNYILMLISLFKGFKQ